MVRARQVALVLAVAAAALCLPAAAGAASAPAAYVRVNQAGYPAWASKRAYLLAGTALPGAAFRIGTRARRVVLDGHARASLRRWSAALPHVYPIHFPRLRPPRTYRILGPPR